MTNNLVLDVNCLWVPLLHLLGPVCDKEVAESERSLQELLGLAWHLGGLGGLNPLPGLDVVHLHRLGGYICTNEVLPVNILNHRLVIEAPSRSIVAVHFACRAPC